GGDKGRLLSDGAVYTPATGKWAKLPAMPGVPQCATGCWQAISVIPAWTGTELVVWVTWQKVQGCGPRCDGVYEKQTGYRLQAGKTVWGQIGTIRVVTDFAVPVWTGSSVLVMGGVYCPSSCPATAVHGSSFDPATGQWQSVPGFSLMEGQWPAVWTGRAFVDLNDGPGGYHGTGAPLQAYDPGARSWTIIPQRPIGGVLGGAYPRAVWTGTELLAWGEGTTSYAFVSHS
ncbi:MAG TPA: hypothetical protein VGS21_01040, partial [Acidimicrobiales bacterium]|nr:hypothetical protein [Acidimicrobiales bacterium]